jgi:hypothetical protein
VLGLSPPGVTPSSLVPAAYQKNQNPLTHGFSQSASTISEVTFSGWRFWKKAPKPLSELKGKPEPKPRYGLHNLYNLGVAAGLFSAFWYGNDIKKNFHGWSANRVETIQKDWEADQAEKARKAELEPIKVEEQFDWPKISGRDWAADAQQVGKVALDTVAKMDHKLYQKPTPRYLMDLYFDLLRWEALTISVLALLAARQRQIRPSQIWSELNKRGLTGKEQKIAVISSWGKPKDNMKKQKLTEIKPDKTWSDFRLFFPGSPVMNLISEGAPDASFIALPALSRKDTRELLIKANEIYSKAVNNPVGFDLIEVRKLYAPIVNQISNSIDTAVKEGATQIVISFNPEQTMIGYLFARMALTYMDLGWRKVKSGFLPSQSGVAKRNNDARASRWNLIEKCKNLLKEGKHAFPIQDELVAVYAPLKEALDKAYVKNIPVIIEAGNYGGHKGNRPNAMGNMNPLCLIDHPGLIIAGSTDQQGQISDYTSEYNDAIQPTVGALGSHEVVAKRTSVFDRAWGQKLLFPLGSFFFNYLRGVSFFLFNKPLWMQLMGPFGSVGTRLALGDKGGLYPAADLAILMQKMQQIDPSLKVEEAKAILMESVSEARFSEIYQERLLKEIQCLGPDNIRLNPYGFVKTLDTTLKSLQPETLREMKLNTPLGKLQIVPNAETQSLGLTLISALDLVPSTLSIPQQAVLGNPEPLTVPVLAQWVNEVTRSEEQKLVLASPEQKNEIALNAEKARRVGAGTVSNRHYDVLIRTEEVKKQKEAAALKQMAEQKVLVDSAEAARVAQLAYAEANIKTDVKGASQEA